MSATAVAGLVATILGTTIIVLIVILSVEALLIQEHIKILAACGK